MKNYTIKKTDRRMNGHEQFAWVVMPTSRKDLADTQRSFHLWRKFCWETFGPSMERDWAIDMINRRDCEPLPWAWDVQWYTRIYLRGDEEKLIFSLKF